jgi:hypothetical protein
MQVHCSMARIRTVKPEFWQSESLATLDPMTRLLAIGLLNHSDDEGYFRATPALIRAAVFPFDDSANIPRMIQELSSAGFLRIGTADDGRQYGWIVNFLKHQRVDKPKQSEIKDLCEFQDDSKIVPGVIHDPSKGERKGKEGNREQGKEGNIGSAEPDAAKAANPRSIGHELDYTSWPQMPSPQVLTDWLAMRRRLRANVSQTVISRFGRELQLAVDNGFSVDDCLAECITSNWKGFKFSWLKNREASNGTNQYPVRQTRSERNEQAHRDYIAELDRLERQEAEANGSYMASALESQAGE